MFGFLENDYKSLFLRVLQKIVILLLLPIIVFGASYLLKLIFIDWLDMSGNETIVSLFGFLVGFIVGSWRKKN